MSMTASAVASVSISMPTTAAVVVKVSSVVDDLHLGVAVAGGEFGEFGIELGAVEAADIDAGDGHVAGHGPAVERAVDAPGEHDQEHARPPGSPTGSRHEDRAIEPRDLLRVRRRLGDAIGVAAVTDCGAGRLRRRRGQVGSCDLDEVGALGLGLGIVGRGPGSDAAQRSMRPAAPGFARRALGASVMSSERSIRQWYVRPHVGWWHPGRMVPLRACTASAGASSEQAQLVRLDAAELVVVDLDAGDVAIAGQGLGLRLDLLGDEHAAHRPQRGVAVEAVRGTG